MTVRKSVWASAGAMALLTAAVMADENPAVKDLTATIALQGLPCGKVTEAHRNGDSDYTATCQDGNRYRVFVDASGRVVVQKM